MSLLIHPLGEPSKIVPGGAPLFNLSPTLTHGKIISGGRAYPEAEPQTTNVCTPPLS